jgi:hypothetical protein
MNGQYWPETIYWGGYLWVLERRGWVAYYGSSATPLN